MNVDTSTIRRLRDALIAGGRLEDGAAAGSESPSVRVRDASINRVAPFAEAMYLVMMADGRDHRDESAVIRGAMRALTDGLLDDSALDELVMRCQQLLADQGAEARLQAIGSRICANRLDRETAFTLAAAVALADEDVGAEEATLLSDIAEWFGVASGRQQAILRQFDEPA